MNILTLKQAFAKYSLPIFSGVLIGTSFIPFPPWATFFCFVPLWLFFLKADSLKTVFIGSWITQFVLTLIGFNWIVYTAHEFGGFNYLISVVALIAFAATANLYIPLASCLTYGMLHKRKLPPLAVITVLALLTTLCEIFSATIFKWNFAYTWYWVESDIVQTAEIFGFQGLSSLIILLNIPAYLIITSKVPKIRIVSAAGIIGFFVVMTLWGSHLKSSLPETDSSTKALIVQANISNAQKIAAEIGNNADNFIVSQFLELTSRGLQQFPDANFVVWPETAFPDFLNERFFNQPTSKRVRDFFAKEQKHLVTGGYTYHAATATDRARVSNSLYFLEPGMGEYLYRYDKSILLIFGEYVPGMQTFPFLKKLFPFVGGFKPGNGPTVYDFAGVKIGAQICYESLYPEFSLGLARKGAQIITNVTNDSWYGPYQEPYQHLYMTLARSIETRRPMVRSTNTGISTVSLANGDILEKSPIGEAWYGQLEIPYHSEPKTTFYQKYPNLITALIFALLFAILGLIQFNWFNKKS